MTASSQAQAESQLAGLKALVVEDESLVSFLVEDMLHDLGFAEVWHAAGIAEAASLLAVRRPDVAVLDVNLGGEFVFPVAARLEGDNIPFVFATGYGRNGLPDHWRHRPVIQKPYGINTLAGALGTALTSSPPA